MYPIIVALEEKKVTVIGGGRVAYRKVQGLVEAGAKVTVIAPNLDSRFLALEDKIVIKRLSYEESHLENSFLVIAATNEPSINEAIGIYCKVHQILCNVVDHKALSSFIVPSVVRRGDLLISVSTSGKSPLLAKKIKNELAATYGPSYEAYVDQLGEIREEIVHKPISDREKKKQLEESIRVLENRLE